MTVDVKSDLRAHSRVRCSPCGSSEIMQHRSSVETEPVTSTVDHADIRGLVTTLLVSVGCLPRSRHEGLSQPHNVHEGCTLTGAAPPPRIEVAPISVVAGCHRPYAAVACAFAIAHMNPASSRAMAAAIVFACWPRRASFLYRPHKRTCARHAMSQISWGSCCCRAWICSDTFARWR